MGKRICAWCKLELGDRDLGAQKPAPEAITHGICTACKTRLMEQIGQPVVPFLDLFPAPIVVVDPQGLVRGANLTARGMLKKEYLQLNGRRGGDVFECVHATLPGGCGNTVHCEGCTVRRAVMHTLKTGEARFKVPAYIDQQDGDQVRRVHLLITTEKTGDYVLLRIDE